MPEEPKVFGKVLVTLMFDGTVKVHAEVASPTPGLMGPMTVAVLQEGIDSIREKARQVGPEKLKRVVLPPPEAATQNLRLVGGGDKGQRS